MITQREFEEIKNKLAKDGFNPGSLLSFASMFGRLHCKDDLNEVMAQFHNYAGQLPYIEDFDFGALVLQFTAHKLDDLSLKKRLLKEAVYRARWCVQSAASGSEMIVRGRHLRKLEADLEKLAKK
jgi:hypothetical protein